MKSDRGIWYTNVMSLSDIVSILLTAISLSADCFAVALARLKKAELYTGDPEFKAVEKDIKVVWL